MANRLHPSGWLVVSQAVFHLGSFAEQAEGVLQPAFPDQEAQLEPHEPAIAGSGIEDELEFHVGRLPLDRTVDRDPVPDGTFNERKLDLLAQTDAALYVWRQRAGRLAPASTVLSPVPIDDSPPVRTALETLSAHAVADPDNVLERSEIVRLVHATLDHLPPRYGEALEMRYLEGCSVDQVARRLELGYKATESLLSRARAAFREGFGAVAELAAEART